jgi:hypothetical protein
VESQGTAAEESNAMTAMLKPGVPALFLDDRGHPGYCHGAIHVDIQDAEGQSLTGFEAERAIPCTRNTASKWQNGPWRCEWQSGRSTDALRGQVIRLQFRLEQAHLYSFRAQSAT